jgi:hypothetical protein
VVAVVAGAPSGARAELLKGPYLQDVTPNRITVMWHAAPAVAGRVIVEGPGLPDGGRSIEVAPASIPKVVVDGLRPATRYRYRVELGDARDRGEFATAPPIGAPVAFSFVVFGDNGRSAENHRRVIERAAAEVADVVLGTGDMVNEGGNLAEWQTLFSVELPLIRDNVIFPSLGNHDDAGPQHDVTNFHSFFSLPRTEGRRDQVCYYAFTYGASRFLVLDSNAGGSFALTDETAWLESQLAAARQDRRIRHIFVPMHHPPFSISLHSGEKNLRERWTPLFERYGVDAVFSGHDHVYQRAENNGVYYFVSGGGGATTYKPRARPLAADRARVKRFESVHHYLRVTVDGDLVEVSAIRTDGSMIETTSWGEPRRPVAAPLAVASETEHVAPFVAGAAAGPERRNGVRWLGMAGGVAAVIAALVMVLALRRDPA